MNIDMFFYDDNQEMIKKKANSLNILLSHQFWPFRAVEKKIFLVFQPPVKGNKILKT